MFSTAVPSGVDTFADVGPETFQVSVRNDVAWRVDPY